MLHWSRIIIAVAVCAVGLLITWICRTEPMTLAAPWKRQNNEAISNADLAGFSRRECVDAGGVFDFAAVRCLRAE